MPCSIRQCHDVLSEIVAGRSVDLVNVRLIAPSLKLAMKRSKVCVDFVLIPLLLLLSHGPSL